MEIHGHSCFYINRNILFSFMLYLMLSLLFAERVVEGEEVGYDVALGHGRGEAVGGQDGAVAVTVGL